jgi:hypothetical protein
MGRLFRVFIGLWIALVSVNAADEMRVAVSIRYLEIKGTSHATFIASAAESKNQFSLLKQRSSSRSVGEARRNTSSARVRQSISRNSKSENATAEVVEGI